MNGFGILFTLATAGLMLWLPRAKASLPLVMGAVYITLNQQVEIGPLHLPLIRILIAVGILRMIYKREGIAGGWNVLDRLMIVWAIWATCSLALHTSTIWITR